MNFFGVQYCISSLQRKSKNNLCTFSHLVPCRVGSFDNLDSPMASCGGIHSICLLYIFYVFPHALLPKIRWISYRAFLRMGSWMKAFGPFRTILMINMLVLKEVVIVALVVVGSISCSFFVFLLLFHCFSHCLPCSSCCGTLSVGVITRCLCF